jgi:hypothetical protein
MNLSDGIHPNAAGQKILAETVWYLLEPVAREVASHEKLESRQKGSSDRRRSTQ